MPATAQSRAAALAAAAAAAAVAQEAAGGSVPARLPVLRLVLSAAVAQRAAAGAHLAPQLWDGCQVGAGQAGAGAQRLGTFDAQRQGSLLGGALPRLPPLLGPQGRQQGPLWGSSVAYVGENLQTGRQQKASSQGRFLTLAQVAGKQHREVQQQ